MPKIEIDHLAATLDQIREAKARAKQWSTIADVLMADVKDAVGEAEEATIDGRPVVRHSVRQVTRLDTKALRAEIPEAVLAPYLKTTDEHRYELLED